MHENSELFNQALNLLNSQSYKEAIELLKKDLEVNSNKPITYNYIGYGQAQLGIIHKGKSLLESAIQHFLKAIAMTELAPGKKYHDAEENLKWAKKELMNLKQKNISKRHP